MYLELNDIDILGSFLFILGSTKWLNQLGNNKSIFSLGGNVANGELTGPLLST